MSTRFFSVIAVVAVSATSVDVSAQSAPQALDAVSFWIGGYRSGSRIDLSARDSTGTLDTGTIGARDFTSTLPRLRAEFLLGERQGLAFDYYGFERKRDFALSDTFTYEGQTFAADAQARTRLGINVGNAAYRWWFGEESTVWGVGLGAAYYRVDVDVRGEASVAGNVVDGRARYRDDAIAPLAQLGWRHAFSDSFRAYADLSGIVKRGGSLEGHVVNASVGLEWLPWRNVGLGVEYSAMRIKLDADRDRYTANADIRLRGPSTYLRFRF